MEETQQSQGSFKFLRGFLGTIAGGLSSLVSLPFGKRKKPEDPSPQSTAGLDQTGGDLSKLYPDMELSETRKRARLSLDAVFEDTVQYSTGNSDPCLDLKGVRGSSETDLGEPRAEFAGVSSRLGEVQHCLDEFLSSPDVTALRYDGALDASHGENETKHSPSVSHDKGAGGHDEELPDAGEDFEALPDAREDSDEYLANFRSTLVAKRVKQQKQEEDSLKEESPRKRVRFGESMLGDNQTRESSQQLKKGSRSSKRKHSLEAEDKNEKKLRALKLSEEPVRPEGKTSTVGMVSLSTRKRNRADDGDALLETAPEESKLYKVVLVENLPLNASRKDITKVFSQFGSIDSMHLQPVSFQDEKTSKRSKRIKETSKIANRQSARIMYKDELSARTAVAHNLQEFNGIRLRVSAAHAHVELKEGVPVPVDESWSVFVSNTPMDVKDEELRHLFSGVGSLKLDVIAVRVMRDSHTGLGKGTAYIFFKTEDDVNRLLSSRQALKVRGRVLRVSRALANSQSEESLLQRRVTKRLMNRGPDDSLSQEKQLKRSTSGEDVTTAKDHGQVEEPIMTRGRRGTDNVKEPTEIQVPSSHVYTRRQAAASSGPLESLEASPESKRNRTEKHQRGISRSKKIRRT